MLSSGPVLADFVAGTHDRPDVPECVEPSLTRTADERWVVVGYKYGRRAGPDHFRALMRATEYPIEATATCEAGASHAAPEPSCTCGFHALNRADALPMPSGSLLEVMLFGRVVVNEWPRSHDLYAFLADAREPLMLFRAERQVILRADGRVGELCARDACEFHPDHTVMDWLLRRVNGIPDDQLAVAESDDQMRGELVAWLTRRFGDPSDDPAGASPARTVRRALADPSLHDVAKDPLFRRALAQLWTRGRDAGPGDPSEFGARPYAPVPEDSDSIALSLPT